MTKLHFGLFARRYFTVHLLLAASTVLLAPAPLHAESVKIIVPIPPGASLDIMTRVLAAEVGHAQELTFVVENRPGADTIIGTEAAARAAPDGKTLLSVGTGLLINQLLRKTNYDPLESFEPICQTAYMPTVIAVSSKSPYLSLADLFNAARATPGRLTLASIGPASTARLAFERLKRDANAEMTFVPYPGTAPAFDALLGQHVTAYLGESSFVTAQVKAGTVRALAAAAPKRLDALPDVPTLAELGFADVMGELWFGLLAPAKTPKATVERFATAYAAALQVSEVKTKLSELGLYPVGLCGADFGAFLRKQREEYRRIVREADIKPE
jgi:tripartite-type tricarboxylate transporter receptor subunit TctC